jgi:hypothetical protein
MKNAMLFDVNYLDYAVTVSTNPIFYPKKKKIKGWQRDKKGKFAKQH